MPLLPAPRPSENAAARGRRSARPGARLLPAGGVRGLAARPGILPGVTRTDGASVPEDHVIVLFGALGDLARRKLLPGLFHLERAGLKPARYRIIGTSRKGCTGEDFRKVFQEAIGQAATGEAWDRYAKNLGFSAFNADDPGPLVQALEQADTDL